MTALKRLILEAHRRSLWQVLGVYLVTSWIGYQVVLALTDGIGLPDWVPGFALVLFVIGLPIVLATAIVQEGGPLARSRADVEAAPATLDPTLFGDIAADSGATPQPPAPAIRATRRHHFLFTWQRAVLGGITAFLLLGITAGGYVGMRNAGVGPFGSLVTTGRIDAQAPVLVADFTATGADSVLAMAVAQAFRTGLAQSDAITVINATQLRATLQRMGRADERLDVTLAREVAERDGVQVVVVGDVMQAGGRYTLSVSLIAPDGAQLLPPLTEHAAAEADVLAAVDRLAKRVRKEIGDSFGSLRRSAPLSAVTTPSLEALRRYTLGVRAYDNERKIDVAIALLESAVAIDSTFAMAWRKLAAVYQSAGAGRANVAYAATKAYENRERLTEAERYQAIAFYHMSVTQDWRKALAAYQSLLEISPTDASLNNMGLLYKELGDTQAAIETYERAIANDSMHTTPYMNLTPSYMDVGRWASADSLIDVYERRFGAGPDPVYLRAMLASTRGDYAAAEKGAQELLAIGSRYPLHHARGLELLQEIAGTRGRLADAARLQRQSVALAQQRGFHGAAARHEALAALRRLYVAGDAAGALRAVDALMRSERMQQLDRVDWPYQFLAWTYAGAGQPQRARELLAQLERELPTEELGDRRTMLLYMRAAIALAEQRPDAALPDLHAAAQADQVCRGCAVWLLARAHDDGGRADSAAHYYQRYADMPAARRIMWDGYLLGHTLERLTELYLALDRPTDAATTAARFVQLWQHADAELQPRVRAKQELLAQLQERSR